MQAFAAAALCMLFAFIVSGCQYFNGDTPLLIDQSRPIVYIKRPPASHDEPANDPLHGVTGSQLYIRDLASLEAFERNITGELTQGVGAVADPEASWDGRSVIFSMRCSTQSSPRCANDESWNIWIYDVDSGDLAPVIRDETVRNLGDDREPVFLPDGRIAFLSNRQAASRDRLGYQYQGQNDNAMPMVLHLMHRDGSRIEQISFGQTHERSPSVLADGRIMFSRYEMVEGVSRYSLFTIKPDGSDLKSLYGAHSPGDAFVHARELEDGRVIASVLPENSAWDGGALLLLDVKNFSDAESPAPNLNERQKDRGGQQSATIHEIPVDNSLSRFGRYARPYPLYDGNNDVIVSYSFYDKSSEIEFDDNAIILRDVVEAPPQYGLYILNLKTRSLTPIVLPDGESVYTDPIVLVPRSISEWVAPTASQTPGVFGGGTEQGIINIKSVYDTDRLGYMGLHVLTSEERIKSPIPQVSPLNATLDNREQVADLAQLKDPLRTSLLQRPARYLRIVEAIPLPESLSTNIVGKTNYGMRRLYGYTDIEPDGSAMVKVPANAAFSVSVVDQHGRAFTQQSSWLHVLPGETLNCKGCHAPRDTAALNQSPVAGVHPNVSLRNASGQILNVVAQAGETMAETRARIDSSSIEPMVDPSQQDAWSNAVLSEVSFDYSALSTPVPENGIIEFKAHIQPILDLPRSGGITGNNRCSGCHNGLLDDVTNPSGLNLSGSVSGEGRTISYDELLIGKVLFDDDGRPVFEDVAGNFSLKRELPLVTPGYARGSYLIEKLFNKELFADRGLPEFGLDHSVMLSAAEKRIISEWVDLGAQYFNTIYAQDGGLRTIASGLEYSGFVQSVGRLLPTRCGRCHTATLNGGSRNSSFVDTSFYVSGDSESDFYFSSYFSNVDNPAASDLLVIPSSSAGHRKDDGTYVMTEGDQLYNNTLAWIENARQQTTTLQLSVPYVRNTTQ